MTKFALAFVTVSAFAAAAAQAETAVTDTDGNGLFSMEEMIIAYPDMTPEVFKAADADADGSLSADELKAAQTAGTIPS